MAHPTEQMPYPVWVGEATQQRYTPILYVPETLDVEAILPQGLKKHADHARYFVHFDYASVEMEDGQAR